MSDHIAHFLAIHAKISKYIGLMRAMYSKVLEPTNLFKDFQLSQQFFLEKHHNFDRGLQRELCM